jgi:hypothetical protein
MKSEPEEMPLRCVRCYVNWADSGSDSLCSDCTRRLLSAAYCRRPAHRPVEYEPSPWQENAIRFLEGDGS